jgi:hypothetical protein
MKPYKNRRRIIELRWRPRWKSYDPLAWVLVEKKRAFDRLWDKETAVYYGAGKCHDIVREGGLAQLRVFNKNGRIAFERTYPRSSDPGRRKG